MNNSREKFEAWNMPKPESFYEDKNNYDLMFEAWQAASEQSQKEIAELQAREKVLVEAISISLNCIREEINLNNYTETLLGDFISDYGDMVTILQYALANVRGEVK